MGTQGWESGKLPGHQEIRASGPIPPCLSPLQQTSSIVFEGTGTAYRSLNTAGHLSTTGTITIQAANDATSFPN